MTELPGITDQIFQPGNVFFADLFPVCFAILFVRIDVSIGMGQWMLMELEGEWRW